MIAGFESGSDWPARDDTSLGGFSGSAPHPLINAMVVRISATSAWVFTSIFALINLLIHLLLNL